MRTAIVCAAAALIAAAPAAHGQSLDYGALEKLFGEPVTTSVTGSPQRAGDVPATMEIVTADDIRRSGARDIPGVLAHVPGIDVLQWSNDAVDISVRGYDQAYSHRLLVLIDGRQVYTDYYGFTPWSTLPVELADIRQIEIVKGPNSALYGFNAVGGVINIITRNPLYDDRNTVSLSGGTQTLAQGSGVGTVKFGDRAALRISAGGYRDNDFSTPIPPAAFAGVSRIGEDRGAVDVNAAIRLDDKVQLRLDVSHVRSDENQGNPAYFFGFARYRTDSAMAELDADTGYGLLQAKAYANWFGQIGSTTPALGNLDVSNRVTVVQLQDIVKLGGANTVRGTFEYRHDSAGTTPFSGGNVFYDDVSVGGMWAWQALPPLTVTNALRLDGLMLGRIGTAPLGYPLTNADWNRAFVEPSFNSGVVWKASGLDTLRATAARGVQLPSLADFGAFLTSGQLVKVTGLPNLNPTVVTSYELGWDRIVAPFGGHFRASLFHEDSDAILAIRGGLLPAAGVPYLTRANVGSSTANGIELSVEGTVQRDWRWGLSYRPEIVTDHFRPGLTPENTVVDFQHTSPAHVITAHLGWASGKWEIDGYLRYQSQTLALLPGPNGQGAVLTPINDYVSLDARAAYRLTDRVTLALSGQNLQRATTQQTSGPNVERRVLATVSVKF